MQKIGSYNDKLIYLFIYMFINFVFLVVFLLLLLGCSIPRKSSCLRSSKMMKPKASAGHVAPIRPIIIGTRGGTTASKQKEKEQETKKQQENWWRELDVLFCAGGIYFFYMFYAILQEQMYPTQPLDLNL